MSLYSRRGILAAAAFGAYAAGSARRAGAADSFVLRLSLPTPPGTSWNVASDQLAANVLRKSKGRLKIEIYPNGALAGQQESVNGLLTGLVDLTFQSNGVFERLFPQVEVLELPFLFRDVAAAVRVIDGPVGQQFNSDFLAKGLIPFFWSYAAFREFETTTKAVRTVDDMKGLRCRIAGGTVNTAMYQALGAIPVSVDYTEIFTALSQHTLDGMDVSPDALLTGKFYTVIQHIALTHQVFSYHPMVGSKAKIESLPPDLQTLLKTEMTAMAPTFRSSATKFNSDALNELKTHGVTFTEIDYASFRKAMDPVYTLVQQKLGADLVQRVTRAAGAA